MIVIRSRLSLFLCFAVLSTVIIPARGIFAAEKALAMMQNSDTLDGWKLRGPKFISKWVVGVAKIDPKNPKKLTVVKSNDGAIELTNTKKGGVEKDRLFYSILLTFKRRSRYLHRSGVR